MDVVAAGNDVLAGVARRSARAIAILPTSIDTARVPAHHGHGGRSADHRLDRQPGEPGLFGDDPPGAGAAHASATRRSNCGSSVRGFRTGPRSTSNALRGARRPKRESLAAAHIGVMPLTDDAWARGKCAFKLLQYMAAALPCVASPVGANTEAVHRRRQRLSCAAPPKSGSGSLESLIRSPELRARFGAGGRKHVESRYALRTYQARLFGIAGRLARRGLMNAPRAGSRYPSRHAGAAYLSDPEPLHLARRNSIRASTYWTTPRTSGRIGTSIGRSENSC